MVSDDVITDGVLSRITEQLGLGLYSEGAWLETDMRKPDWVCPQSLQTNSGTFHWFGHDRFFQIRHISIIYYPTVYSLDTEYVLNKPWESSWWINKPSWSNFYFLYSHINCDPNLIYFFAASCAICLVDGIVVVVVALDFMFILRERKTPRTYRSSYVHTYRDASESVSYLSARGYCLQLENSFYYIVCCHHKTLCY